MLIKNNKLSYVLLGMALPKNIMLILSVAIGEATAPMYENFETVDVSDTIIYTFFTLRDISGQIDVGSGVQLGLQEMDMTSHTRSFHTRSFMEGISMLHFDYETGLMYFVAKYRNPAEQTTDNISMDFVIDRIFADSRSVAQEINIDFPALLEQHQATFFVAEE